VGEADPDRRQPEERRPPAERDQRPPGPDRRRGGPDRRRASRVVRVRVTPSTVALIVAALVGAIVVRSVAVSARRVAGWVLASLVAAILVRPLVDRLARRIPRALAILVVVLSIVGASGYLADRFSEGLRQEVASLERVVPEAATRLENRYDFARRFQLHDRVVDWIDNLKESTRGDPAGTVSSVSTYLVCGVLMVFFVVYGPRMLLGGLNQVRDVRKKRRYAAIVRATLVVGGVYLTWTLAEGLAVGILTWLACWLGSVPAAVPLAVIAGLLGMLPTVGVVLAGVPTVLLAAAFRPGWITLLLAALFLALQATEIQVLRPRVTSASLYVGPALAVVAALVGFDVYGVGGAVCAFAVLVFLLALQDAASSTPPSEADDKGDE
jgi:predicted PurR-regulated permease PerM